MKILKDNPQLSEKTQVKTAQTPVIEAMTMLLGGTVAHHREAGVVRLKAADAIITVGIAVAAILDNEEKT